MKKMIFLLLFTILMSGCNAPKLISQSTPDMNKIGTEVSSTIMANIKNTEESKSTKTPSITPTISTGISVDNGLLNDDITLPASLFSGQDMSKFDVNSYANENGFKKAVKNEDGSITITVSKAKHKEMLIEYAANLNETFNEMIGSENTPYVKGVTSNSDFTSVIVDVNSASYQSAIDFSQLTIGISAMLYQQIAGMKQHCVITIRDGITKEIINSVTYPDVFRQ